METINEKPELDSISIGTQTSSDQVLKPKPTEPLLLRVLLVSSIVLNLILNISTIVLAILGFVSNRGTVLLIRLFPTLEVLFMFLTLSFVDVLIVISCLPWIRTRSRTGLGLLSISSLLLALGFYLETYSNSNHLNSSNSSAIGNYLAMTSLFVAIISFVYGLAISNGSRMGSRASSVAPIMVAVP